MEEKLFLYYTNDLHSHFENWSRIVGYLEEQKMMRKAQNQPYWLVDIGDHVDRSHPISEAFLGRANVKLLNEVKYDLATIGNNEGITLNYHDLYRLYDKATFKLICANLESLKGSNPDWLGKTSVLTSPSGVKIGLIGLTAPFNSFYNLLGWQVDSPYEVLDKYLPELAGDCDIILLLSHLGIHDDQEIAERYPEIDVIIGGHTHHLLRDGELVNNTLLTAAGKHGMYVGEVILTWNHDHKQLSHKEAYALETNQMPKDLNTEHLLNEYQLKADSKMKEEVTTLPSTLEFGWFKQTAIMNMLVTTLKKWTKADCAMLNAGLLLDRLEKGKVTYGDVHRICPHPINPCLVELTGKELYRAIERAHTKQFTELKLKGFGFRGEVIGKMIFSGIEVEVTKTLDGLENVTAVSINGKNIEPEGIYKVATADTFTFGRLLPEISSAENKKFFMPEFLRDLLAVALKTNFS